MEKRIKWKSDKTCQWNKRLRKTKIKRTKEKRWNERKRKWRTKKVYIDIEKFNQKKDEEHKKNNLRKKDKELIESILAGEKPLHLIDKKEKEKRVKEFEQNKKYLEYFMNHKKEQKFWWIKYPKKRPTKPKKKEQEEWIKEVN